MDRLTPSPEPVDDVAAVIAADPRPRRDGRPWVMANMVASVDGVYAVHGRSAPLSGPADRETFHAIRSTTDVVLVAAGTARTERYRRPVAEPWAQEARARRGQAPAPLLVLVSRSLDLPPDLPLLRGPGPEPIVLHPATADADSLPAGVRGVAAGTDEIDLAGALGHLADDGVTSVLCEGGPQLLGALVALDLVDELFVTVSPCLVGGGGPSGWLGLHGPPDPLPLVLHRVLSGDDALLLTYRRSDRAGVPAD